MTTDPEGRFVFENVSRAVNQVGLSGAELGLEGFERRIDPGEDVEALEIAAPMRVHVQVEATEPEGVDEVAVLDVSGERLSLSVYHGTSSYVMHELPVQEGRTEPFAVSEQAVTLVLRARGSEVKRVTLKLVRGELNTIRP